MIRLVVEALFYLLRTEWLMHRGGIRNLHDALKRKTPATISKFRYQPQQICLSIDVACVLYCKTVLCLQRSAATAMLLRHHGFPAELVIGARIVPLKSHAWVELNDLVINDKTYMHDIYRELERC